MEVLVLFTNLIICEINEEHCLHNMHSGNTWNWLRGTPALQVIDLIQFLIHKTGNLFSMLCANTSLSYH